MRLTGATSERSADVVVVGGGCVGLAVAWRAAQRGLRVEVVDPEPGGGRGAWRVAAGMLAPVTEVHYGEEPLLRLNLDSAARYPAFVAELEELTGVGAGYRACGTLAVAADNDDLAALLRLLEFQLRLGLEAERMTSRQCRRREPALAPSVRGGVLVAGDHQVDPRALGAALAEACRSAGVTITPGRVGAFDGPAGDPGPARVDAVVLEGGDRVACGQLVVAAGAWSSALPLPAAVPVRPVKGQILRLSGPADRPVLSGTVRAIVEGVPVYLVPRATGEVVVGATAEEKGFDPALTAGAVFDLLRAAVALVPEVAELELREASVSFRPATPDNAPLIGPAEGTVNVVLATGHHRNGILLTPVTADSVAAHLAGAGLPEVAAPFSPARFRPAA